MVGPTLSSSPRSPETRQKPKPPLPQNSGIAAATSGGGHTEAIEVLRGMGRAGCAPDFDSFDDLIDELSEARMVDAVVEVMAEMVRVHKLSPRRETVVKAVAAMWANREARRAVEVVEMLEAKGVGVGFEVCEAVLEGCLDEKRFVLAGKFVVGISERGFIPYLKVRLRRLLEGLVTIGEAEYASVVRRRFAEMSS